MPNTTIIQKFIPIMFSAGKVGELPPQDTHFMAESLLIGVLLEKPAGSHGEVRTVYEVAEVKDESPLVLPKEAGKILQMKPH